MSVALKKTKNVDVIKKIAEYVSSWTGNQFQEKHYSMIEGRLQKRLNELNLDTIDDYFDYFEENSVEEKSNLISLLTTHHTYFFRESSHFDFLRDSLLDEKIKALQAKGEKTLRILCLACSRGHEVYSLACYLSIHMKKYPGMDFEIVGTDIDPKSVSYAKNGVYPYEELKKAPHVYIENNWVRGTGDISDYAKIKQTVRSKCDFYTENLFELSQKTTSRKYDVVFCRNVFIYFNAKQIAELANQISKVVKDDGHFFIGISESLRGMDVPFQPIGPSVYDLKTNKPATATAAAPTNVVPMKRPEAQRILKVLCVDDSPSIHKILDMILVEKSGFKVVGHAMSGKEAEEFMKKNQVDVVTLDIHMPEMTGVEYLHKNFNKNHPPVIMVTSVSRENSDLAIKALDFGASDYVEKPTLANMVHVAEELRSKLKSSYDIFLAKGSKSIQLDKSFSKEFKIVNPQNCVRVIATTLMERDKVKSLVEEVLTQNQFPKTVIYFANLKPNDMSVVEGIFKSWKANCQHISKGESPVMWTEKLDDVKGYIAQKNLKFVSVQVNQSAVNQIKDQFNVPEYQYLIEEGPSVNYKLLPVKWQVFPLTSFNYVSSEYFSKA